MDIEKLIEALEKMMEEHGPGAFVELGSGVMVESVEFANGAVVVS